jgi:hypothetical protein
VSLHITTSHIGDPDLMDECRQEQKHGPWPRCLPGPRLIEKGIHRAAVWQRLRKSPTYPLDKRPSGSQSQSGRRGSIPSPVPVLTEPSRFQLEP